MLELQQIDARPELTAGRAKTHCQAVARSCPQANSLQEELPNSLNSSSSSLSSGSSFEKVPTAFTQALCKGEGPAVYKSTNTSLAWKLFLQNPNLVIDRVLQQAQTIQITEHCKLLRKHGNSNKNSEMSYYDPGPSARDTIAKFNTGKPEESKAVPKTVRRPSIETGQAKDAIAKFSQQGLDEVNKPEVPSKPTRKLSGQATVKFTKTGEEGASKPAREAVNVAISGQTNQERLARMQRKVDSIEEMHKFEKSVATRKLTSDAFTKFNVSKENAEKAKKEPPDVPAKPKKPGDPDATEQSEEGAANGDTSTGTNYPSVGTKTWAIRSTKDTIAKFNRTASLTEENLKKNPFSESYSLQKFDKTASDYGRPPPGSKTEKRGIRAGDYVQREILFLCEIIDQNAEGEPPNKWIQFGRLFQIYSHYSDKLVGMLIRARKYGLVDFEGEMLYQRQDDDKLIMMLRSYEEIKQIMKPSGDPANCVSLAS